MKAVASRVTDPKTDVLLLPAVDMEDSGPYEIAEPRVITALETYTPSWLQTRRLKRLAEIVSEQAVLQQQIDNDGTVAKDTYDDEDGDDEGDDHHGGHGLGHGLAESTDGAGGWGMSINGNGHGHGHVGEGHQMPLVHEQEVM